MKVCIMCGQQKAPTEFYRYPYTTNQGKRSIRSESRCKPCARARRLARYADRGEHERSVARAYKAKNKSRVDAKARQYRTENAELLRAQRRGYEAKRRVKAGGLERSLTARVLAEYHMGDGLYLDAYSGALISDPTVDHIVPIAKGGKHEYDNLCVTSKANNSSKHTRSMLQWLMSK